MKNICLFVVLAVLLTAGSVFAQSGVQIIDGTQQKSGPDNYIDDLKLGTEYRIEDWGILKVLFNDTWNAYYNDAGYRSRDNNGEDQADSPILTVEITNTTFKPQNFLDGVDVKFVYDDQWEIKGWWVQHSCIESSSYWSVRDCYVDASKIYEIEPFYKGFYTFGAKVPDFIIQDSKPFRMEVTLGDVELTYHIRK